MTEWRDRFSAGLQTVVRALGSTTMVVAAVLFVVGYLLLGVVAGFTDLWFDVLHAWAGITAFLMVFVIRHAEGRDSRAVLLKLDELIAATSGARDGLIAVEQDALNRQEELEEERLAHGSDAGEDSRAR